MRKKKLKAETGKLKGQAVLRTPSSFSFHASAFTLIELLVVIAIIAILAGLILSTAGGIQKKAARSRAESEIAAMSAALESYKADNGDYPTAANSGTNDSSLYAALCPATNTTNISTKVYFEFSKGMLGSAGIVDPFGTAYYYQYPGSSNYSGTNFFDLYSTAGTSTNTTNQVKWIKNW